MLGALHAHLVHRAATVRLSRRATRARLQMAPYVGESPLLAVGVSTPP